MTTSGHARGVSVGAIDPWRRYEPNAEQPWNLQRVVHLHRRAGLGANWAELQRDLSEGPEASVQRLLEGTPDAVRGGRRADEQEALADRLALAAARSGAIDRLQAAWVFRMLCGAQPLRERLTLMWHDHFATSYLKVADLELMQRQNALLRQHAMAPFGELLRAIVRDPAMLIWLDAPANRSKHPNENLARELMELFTLGIGHFTEADVKQAARALTGWTVEGGEFSNKQIRHDGGAKTILGETRAFDGDALLELLLAHPATAERIAHRLCTTFLGEPTAAGAELREERERALARLLTDTDLDLAAAVGVLLHSQAFFETPNVSARISEPAVHVVWALRTLEMLEPLPATVLVTEWIRRLGQDLFNPPNVGGWPGGRAWLSSRAVIARSNFATALTEGAALGRPAFDAESLARSHGISTDLEAIADWLPALLFGAAPTRATRSRVLAHARAAGTAPEQASRRLVAALLTQPEAHLA